jgi:hypothetical protein
MCLTTKASDLLESAYMYHGSPKSDLSSLKPDRNEYMLDRAVGSHFAADPTVSKRFQKGLYRTKEPAWGEKPKPVEGSLYRTKAPPRSQLHTIYQKNYRDKKTGKVFAKQSDQDAIGSHIAGTVFSQPENKGTFKDWVKHARRVDDDTAEGIHAHLSSGRAPTIKKFGQIAGSDKKSSFHGYVSNFDSGLNQEPRPGFRKEVVHKYLDIMKQRGIKGLVYHNTSPEETGDREGREKVRSKKSYIIFHPEEHPLEKVESKSHILQVLNEMDTYHSGNIQVTPRSITFLSSDGSLIQLLLGDTIDSILRGKSTTGVVRIRD